MYTPTPAQVLLHSELDLLKETGALRRGGNATTAHALVALGVISEIKCHADYCVFDTRAFAPDKWMRLSLDHIVWVSHGGSDLPDNIAITHWKCNMIRQPSRKKRLEDGRKVGTGTNSTSTAHSTGWKMVNFTEIECPWGCGYTNRPSSVGLHKKACEAQDNGKRGLTEDERRYLHTADNRAEMFERAVEIYRKGVNLRAFAPEFCVSMATLHQKIRVPSRKF